MTTTLHPDGENPSSSLNHSNSPWAILEYVGPHSLYFGNSQGGARARILLHTSSWVERMVKVRHEFGFDEPHPRWGRVPESQALDYALQVLDQVVLPLHLGFQKQHQTTNGISSPCSPGDYTYESMVNFYQQTYEELMRTLVALHYQQQQQQQEEPTTTMTTATHSPDTIRQWDQVLALLREAVYEVLPSNKISVLQPPFPSRALIHLDLQPQNLLLAERRNADNANDEDHLFVVSSVLDWEDAAIADPRFEILMLGRKVCANREQAERIWKRYAEGITTMSSPGIKVQHRADDSSVVPLLPSVARLGPLMPWLQLETVHSLLTMLSQSMDLLNGGRNPWESSKDLWGKMEREMARWQDMLPSTINRSSSFLEQEGTAGGGRETGPEDTYLGLILNR